MGSKSKIFNVPDSLVRRYHDEGGNLPPYRTEFMRDRDRLMYATAFRRLSGKTQIYTVGGDDHKKNRLTHTLEVAQIARTIAIALGLNPDLAESIALAHDFGHTPFGHAGERMLHDILIPNSPHIKLSPFCKTSEASIKKRFAREAKENQGCLEYIYGFKHNLQSVRVSALLEDSYRNENKENIGLNLTNFTLYGMMIHSSQKYKDSEVKPNFQNYFKEQLKLKNCEENAWSLEAYVVKMADDIAQWHHDLEDALREGALPLEIIHRTIMRSLDNALNDEDRQKLEKIDIKKEMDRRCIAELSHVVVNTLVSDLVIASIDRLKQLEEKLKEKEVSTPEEFFIGFDSLELGVKKEEIIDFSSKINREEFENVIKNAIHHSRNVERMNEKGKYIIRKLFEAYYAHPQQLPDGPILHLLVDINPEKYPNVENVKEGGIGVARAEFDKILQNPNIYVQCMLMRRICDHIASMTDRYAIEEFNNLYG